MAVSGVSANQYSYNSAYTRKRSTVWKTVNKSINGASITPSNITLHIGNDGIKCKPPVKWRRRFWKSIDDVRRKASWT